MMNLKINNAQIGHSRSMMATSSTRLSRNNARRQTIVLNKKSTTDEVLTMGNKALDGVVDMLPEDVPKDAAKIGVGIVGFILAVTIIKQFISALFFLLVVGGGAYFLYTQSDDTSGDVVADAKKIISKYTDK